MPQHDPIDGVTKYLKKEIERSRPMMPGYNFWLNPTDYITSLYMFEGHFTPGMSLEEELAYKSIKDRAIKRL